MIKDNEVKLIDFKFTDLLGTWQHFTTTLTEYDEGIFTDGLGFDGSSIRGWRVINASDMLVIPDATTAWIDIFNAEPTLSLICTIVDPITREPYDRDPRGVAEKAEAYLQSTGIADTAYFGPEAEFFIFDDVRFSYSGNASFHRVDSMEGHWNSAREEFPNLGYKIRPKEGYFPVSPMDSLQDIRNEMSLELEKAGIAVDKQHHEVATAGQAEIDIRFASLKRMGDNLQYYKYILRNVAKKHNKTVTFMPKPLYADNGSGMHTHISLWKDDKPLFAGNGYAGLSDNALFFIGGILRHAPALTCLTNPTTNSFKRLVPGFEAPVNLAYSARNRSAAIRIPYVANPKGRRIEVRFPDPTANPYLAFAAMLMAGLDGVQNKIHPGDPMDKNLYDLEPEEAAKVPHPCASLDEALDQLDKDREFLTKGGVFTDDMIDAYIGLKMEEVT
ncbi:MAG TPA: type I glutamate--ammonia ligase, partial [Chthoniobacterales bacterium]|nr:type I glutamate--ammonia ligase [Chthoniobacterales bacterium]